MMNAVSTAQAGSPIYQPFAPGTQTRAAREKAAAGNAVDRALQQAQRNPGASLPQVVGATSGSASGSVSGAPGAEGRWWGDDGRLSANFTIDEFRSRDGSEEVKVDRRLIEKLQQLRDYLGVPITINSGYRSPSHNAAVGGAKNSQHMYGTAADISAPVDYQTLLAAARLFFGDGGIGTYEGDGFVHVDTGPQRTW